MSAVIPVHNHARFLADAVKSVLEQTYPAIELIVVDDGSTDDPVRALEPFADSVTLIRQPQSGVSAARNVGVEASSGKYVAFLDSDDLWLPRKLELQMRLFTEGDVGELGLVYTGFHVVDESLRFLGREAVPDGHEALWNTLLLERPIMSISSGGVMPIQVLRDVGGFDRRLSTSTDCDLACRIALRHPVAAVHRPLVLYRQHAGQIHSNPAATRHDMELIYRKFFDGGCLPPSLQRQRRRALANLYVSLAGSHLMRGERLHFTKYVIKALALRPDRVWAALVRLTSPGGGLTRSE